MTPNNPLLNAALDYAARGWPVLPLVPKGKAPLAMLVKRGLKDATTDTERIRMWWATYPDANIGIATGAPGPDVLDIDDEGKLDPAGRAALQGSAGMLAVTGRGMHLYFTGSEERTVGMPYGELRRRGSYVMAPPSIHPTGAVYEWSGMNGSLAAVPPEVVAGRRSAGAGEAPAPVDHVAPGEMYDHLLDFAVRLARAGQRDPEAIHRALIAEFEVRRAPGREYGGDPEDTRRIAEWAARSDIAAREAERTAPGPAPEYVPPPEPGELTLDMSVDEVLNDAGEEIDWLIPGAVPRGYVVKIAGREKVGKGTLTFHLLGALERGEATPFGEAPPRPATALIYTEEPPSSIAEKLRYADIREARILFAARLVGKTWSEKVVLAVQTAQARGCEVLFIDNISRAAGVVEEAGREAAEKIEFLATHTRAADLTLIFDHHHRKGAGAIEDMSRGSTSIAGATDVNLELERVNDDERRITSRGRLFATIWDMDIKLAPERGDYIVTRERDVAQEAFGDAKRKSRLAALESFGDAGVDARDYGQVIGVEKPHRILDDLVKDGVARKVEGAGRRPARWYYLQAPDLPQI